MICLYFIFFILYYTYISKRCNGSIYKPLILLYLLGAICAIYVHYIIDEKEISFLSVSFNLLILSLFFKPIITYSKEIKIMEAPNIQKFELVSYIFIVLGIFSLIFFIKPAIIALAGDALSLRNDMVKNGLVLVEVGISNTIAGTIANFYPLMILFFFYSITFMQNSKWFNSLLLLSSLSYVVHVFAYIGRDGALFWMFSFIYSYFLFKDYLDVHSKTILKKVFMIVAGFSIAGFIIISIGRFGERTSHSSILDPVTESMINYQGQVFNNFGQYVLNVEPDYNIDHLSNLFSSNNSRILERNNDFYYKYGFNANVFSGFITPLYSAFGPLLTIILSFLYSISLSKVFRRKTISFSNLILLTLIYQIPFHCYYYFRLYMNVGTLYIICTLLLCIFYKKRSIK